MNVWERYKSWVKSLSGDAQGVLIGGSMVVAVLLVTLSPELCMAFLTFSGVHAYIVDFG